MREDCLGTIKILRMAQNSKIMPKIEEFESNSNGNKSSNQGIKRYSIVKRVLRIVILGLGIILSTLVLSTVIIIVALSLGSITAPNRIQNKTIDIIESISMGSMFEFNDMRISINLGDFHPTVVLDEIKFTNNTQLKSIEIGQLAIKFSLISLFENAFVPLDATINSVIVEVNSQFENHSLIVASDSTIQDTSSSGLSLQELLLSEQLAEFNFLKILNYAVFLSDDNDHVKLTDGNLELSRNDQEWNGKSSARLGLAKGLTADISATLAYTPTMDKPDLEISYITRPFESLSKQLSLDQFANLENLELFGTIKPRFTNSGQLNSFGVNFIVDQFTIETRNEPLIVHKFQGQAEYMLAENALEIGGIDLVTNFVELKCSGAVYVNRQDNRDNISIVGNLFLNEVQSGEINYFETPIKDLVGQIDFQYLPADQLLDIVQFQLGDSSVSATAQARYDGLKRNGELQAQSDRLSVQQLLNFWPIDLVPQTRKWLKKNLLEGGMNDINAEFSFYENTNPSGMVTFQFDQLTFFPIAQLPPVTNGTGTGSFSLHDLYLVFESANISIPEESSINLNGSWFYIPEIGNPLAKSETGLQFIGEVDAVLKLIDYPPFEFMKKSKIPHNFASGIGSGLAEIHFPLVDKIKLKDVDIDLTGKLSQFSAIVLNNKNLNARTLNLTADNDGVRISGITNLGKLPIDASWNKNFTTSQKNESRVFGKATISDLFWQELGIRLPKGMLQGQSRADLDLILIPEGKSKFKLVSNVKNLEINLPLMNWKKNNGEEGKLIIEGTLSSPLTIDRINLISDDLKINGALNIDKNGILRNIIFDKIAVSNVYTGSLKGLADRNGKITSVELDGIIDIRNTDFGAFNKSPQLAHKLDFIVKKAIFSNGLYLSDIKGTFGGVKDRYGSFSGSVNGKSRIQAVVLPNSRGYRINVQSNDAGAVARATGYIKNLTGGKLNLDLYPSGEPKVFDARMRIENTLASDIPLLIMLINSISIVGVFDQTQTGGISMDEIYADFKIDESGIEIRESFAVNIYFGMTASGTYDLDKLEYNITGAVTPVNLLNKFVKSFVPIDRLFGLEKGEGFGTIRYTITGTEPNPKIRTDPLSILLPSIPADASR